MTRIGRVLSLTAVGAVAALALLAAFRPDLMHIGSVHVVDWIGLMIFISAPLAWLSAIWHWARHFPREGSKAVWGLVVTVGFVPGALLYWFWGAPSAHTVRADRHGPI